MIITTIAGNLGKDAVYKSTAQGQDLCTFSVGASVGYGDRKQTMWFDVTNWGKGSEKLADMLLKGVKVTVSGELSQREYEGKTYLQIRADHVALQGGRNENGRTHTDGSRSGGQPAKGSTTADNSGFGGGGFGADDGDLDDDCPY